VGIRRSANRATSIMAFFLPAPFEVTQRQVSSIRIRHQDEPE
jgi:hypothetical protein